MVLCNFLDLFHIKYFRIVAIIPGRGGGIEKFSSRVIGEASLATSDGTERSVAERRESRVANEASEITSEENFSMDPTSPWYNSQSFLQSQN